MVQSKLSSKGQDVPLFATSGLVAYLYPGRGQEALGHLYCTCGGAGLGSFGSPGIATGTEAPRSLPGKTVRTWSAGPSGCQRLQHGSAAESHLARGSLQLMTGNSPVGCKDFPWGPRASRFEGKIICENDFNDKHALVWSVYSLKERNSDDNTESHS